MRWLRLFLVVILLYGGKVWADCKSDCQNDYQTEIDLCKSLFTDPDDADDLAECVGDAKKGYESCVQECETEADSPTIVTSILSVDRSDSLF